MQIPETEIVVTKDGAEILRKTVRPGDYVIGRDAECEVRVDVDLVSQRHAQLTVNFDHVLIEDLGSDSGTLVNGEAIKTATRLWPNQKIQIGSARVELHRIKTVPPPNDSLAPQTAAVQRLLPEEFLRDKKYDIGKIVAQGGMGAILDAKDATTERRVAMKVMLDGSSPDDLTRFVAEAKVTAQLEHPSIVPVYELSVDENGQVFYTMKMVRGITLRKVLELLAEGDTGTVKKYPLPVLLTIFQKVCDALAFAHAKGVIHRDLKPENIMLDDFGVVLVMDWGLAKVAGGHRAVDAAGRCIDSAMPSSRAAEPQIDRTLAGTIMGTPQYMSPEQARGEVEDLDARSDIYALGAILYHLLALRAPVTGKDAWAIVAKVAKGEIEPLVVGRVSPRAGNESRPMARGDRGGGGESRGAVDGRATRPTTTIPDSLAAVVRKAMAFERDQRYWTVEELQADLTAYQNGRATRAENASLGKQLVLLVKRHKALFGTAFTAWLIITTLAVWFVIKITASERRATHNAEVAAANEQKAVERGEETRRALAKSQLALAEAAYREHDGLAMQVALAGVPDDLRDGNWSYLLEHADNSITTLRTRSSGNVTDVAAHPKKPGVFAIVADDGSVAMVEAATGVRLLEFRSGFKAGKGAKCHLAISPDGEKLAIGDYRLEEIVIHSTRDGKTLAEWSSAPSDRLQFSPDGHGLLQVSKSANTINLLDAATGRTVWSSKSDGENANNFGVFAPDGQTVLTSFNKEGLRLLSVKDGAVVCSYPDARGSSRFAISPDGARIFSMNNQGPVKCIENKDDGRVIYQFRADASTGNELACTADGQRIVTLAALPGGKQSIKVWDAQTGTLLQTLMGGRGHGYRIGVHPVSPEIVVAGEPSKVWNLPTAQEKWKIREYHSVVGAFWGTDDLLWTGHGSGAGVRLLDLGMPNPEKQPLWEMAGEYPYLVAVSADARFAAIAPRLVTAIGDASVQVLRLNGRAVEVAGSIDAKGALNSLLLSPDGALLFMVGNGKVFDRASGKALATIYQNGIKGPYAVSWVGNTRLVMAVSVGGVRGATGAKEQLILWDAATGQQIKAVESPTAILSLAALPGATFFAEAGADRMVRLRDAATLEVKREFRAHDDAITALALHPSRPILASASDDLTVKLWDLESGRLLEELRGPVGRTTRLEISPGGKRLACWADQMTRIWEPKSFNEKPEDKVDADGWENVLAELKPEAVAKTGHGWQRTSGVLLSPNASNSSIVLPGDFAQSSYQVRVKLRQLAPQNVLAVLLPVADRQVVFNLDGFPDEGHFTSLAQIDGHGGNTVPGAVHGKQIRDSDQHELQVSVRLEGAKVAVEATLDDAPLYQWSGPVTALSLNSVWSAVPPGTLALGTSGADWVVYGVKVKRLEK